jgi:GNAT superfamily N-acetyltransferase
MSLYAEYLLEKENKHYIEMDGGFITFLLIPENRECFIETVFVKKEKRNEGLAVKLEAEVIKIAKEAGCSFLSGVVYPGSVNSTESMKVMLQVGYKLHSCDGVKINIVKEI